MTQGMSIDAALREAPLWGIGEIQSITPLAGGTTNTSYLIETIRSRYVVRLNSQNAYRLGINRSNEVRALKAIQGQPFAPELIYYCPQLKYCVTRFIDGTNLQQQSPTAAELAELHTIIATLKRMPCESVVFDYAARLRSMHQLLEDEQKITPELSQKWTLFETALDDLTKLSWQPVFCHHDLTPANIIRSETGLKLIDWEYARLGHPSFDTLTIAPDSTTTDEETLLLSAMRWLEELWHLLLE